MWQVTYANTTHNTKRLSILHHRIQRCLYQICKKNVSEPKNLTTIPFLQSNINTTTKATMLIKKETFYANRSHTFFSFSIQIAVHVCIFAVSSLGLCILACAANNVVNKNKKNSIIVTVNKSIFDIFTQVSLFPAIILHWNKRIQWQRCVYKIEIDKKVINNK